MSYSTVFLDRDGVINHDSPTYIKRWAEFHFIPGSRKAIARLTRTGIPVILITNQSAVNRGMISLDTLDQIHDRMCRSVADSGGQITDIFFCPHRPDEGCPCRKPEPGLILAAQERHGIDLSRAVMVGDSAKDVRAGKTAGCGRTILVESGCGESALPSLERSNQRPDCITADLLHAVEWLLEQTG